MLSRIFTLSLFLLISGCKNVNNDVTPPVNFNINTTHLDALYQEIILSDDTVGIIHIYSEYPDYKWVGDDDEGITCVDDVARAAIFYLDHYKANENTESLRKANNLIEFLIYMQSENGFFYNFTDSNPLVILEAACKFVIAVVLQVAWTRPEQVGTVGGG